MARNLRCIAVFAAAVLSMGGLALAAADEPPLEGATGAPDDLLQSLEEAFGHRNSSLAGPFADSVRRDLPELEAALAPTLGALPAAVDGRFGTTGVRYALHKLFTKLRGWSLAGLDPQGGAWNSTWTDRVTLLSRAPADVRSVVKEHTEGPGLSARGVAVIAVLLQHLAREDAARHLEAVFHASGLPLTGALDRGSARSALDAHVASQILSQSPASTDRSKWRQMVADIAKVYPHWRELQKAVDQEFERAFRERTADFAGLVHVAGVVGENWGRWTNSECTSIKRDLMRVEDRGSGRVRLADFYGAALHEGTWQFSESVEYLRHLGALDETNPRNPRVIIPNYVGAPGNCIADSDVMSVCCISECEEIMARLEGGLRAPQAPPAEIAALVAALPSSSVPADRDLSPVMLNRLNRIAADSGGTVPLHGRLFAQWLHHAYPRECPYPHLSGATRPQQMLAFVEQTGLNITASREEMAAHAGARPRARPRRGESRPLESAPWSHEEELFVPQAERPAAWVALQAGSLAAAAAVSALGLSLLRMARSARLAGRAPQAQQADPSKLYPV